MIFQKSYIRTFSKMFKPLTFPTRNHDFAEVCVFTFPVSVREVKFRNGKTTFCGNVIIIISWKCSNVQFPIQKTCFLGLLLYHVSSKHCETKSPIGKHDFANKYIQLLRILQRMRSSTDTRRCMRSSTDTRTEPNKV